MCSAPAPRAPAAPPPPSPPPPQPAAEIAPASASGQTSSDIANRVRRQGRNSLRIETTNANSDRTGLNIPVS